MFTLRTTLALALAATIGTAHAHAECSLQSLGTVQGTYDLIASSGTVAIVAAGGSSSATLLDITGASPRIAGTVTGSGSASALSVAVVDLQDLALDPTGHAVYPTETVFLGQGASTGGKLELFDVDDLGAPVSAGTADLSAAATGIAFEADSQRPDDAVSGWIYVSESTAPGTALSVGFVEVFELHTDRTLVRTFQFSGTSGPGAMSGFEGIAFSGGTFATVGGEGFDSFTASADRSSFSHAGHLALPARGEDVAPTGFAGVFAVADGASGYVIVSATSADSPSIVASESTTTPAVAVASSGTASVFSLGSGGWVLVDLASTSSPRELSSGDTPGSGEDIAFVRSPNGLQLVLVADGASGVAGSDVTFCLCSHVFGTIANPSAAIAQNDRTIYGVSGTSFYTAVVSGNLDDKGTLTLAGSAVDVASAFPARYAFVAETVGSAGKLEVVNANSVNSPSISGSLDLPFVPGAIVAKTGFVFVGGRDGSLWVVSTSTPSAPTKAAELAIGSTGANGISDLALEDNVLVVAGGTAGLVLVDIGTAGTPALLGSYSTGESAVAVDLFDDYAYVAFGTGRIDVVDIRAHSNPAKISSIDSPGAEALVAFFGRVVATRGTAGVSMYDVVDPANPGTVESIDTPGTAVDVLYEPLGPGAAGLVVADSGSGLMAIEISACLATAAVPTPSFTSNPVPAMAGEAVTFTDDSANRPTSWSWNFGDGSSSTSQNPSHTFSNAGVYNVTLTATNLAGSASTSKLVFVGGTTGSPVTGGSAAANVWYVAASARSAGVANTLWSTDVVLFNRSGVPAQVYLAFLASGRSNASGDPAAVVTVPAGSTVELRNIVEAKFGLTNAAGGIQIVSDASSLLVTSRTFNSGGGNGTYGQYIPGSKVSAALTSGKTAYLIQLSQNDEFRTNVGFQSASSGETDVLVRLYSSDGTMLASKTYTLSAFGYLQQTQIFSALGVGQQANARAEIQVTGGTGPVFPYASVVDNTSGDPVYQPGLF